MKRVISILVVMVGLWTLGSALRDGVSIESKDISISIDVKSLNNGRPWQYRSIRQTQCRRINKCISKHRCGFSPLPDEKKHLIKTKVSRYNVPYQLISLWGRDKICTIYNRGNVCISDVKLSEKTDNQVMCEKAMRWSIDGESIGDITVKPINMEKQCKYKGVYSTKRLDCSNIDFDLKYEVDDDIIGYEKEKRTNSVTLRGYFIFDVVLPTKSGKCVLKPTRYSSYRRIRGQNSPQGEADLYKDYARWATDQVAKQIAEQAEVTREVKA